MAGAQVQEQSQRIAELEHELARVHEESSTAK